MNKCKLNLRKVVAIAICLAGVTMFSSCEEDENSKSMPDPTGTITIKVRNWSNGGTSVYPEGCEGTFYITSANNFRANWGNWTFARVGKVAGLGNVTGIPSSGYATEVSVEPGCGYVAKIDRGNGNVTYVRIYVVSWTEASTGGIIGAEIKYQSPFNP